MPCIEVLQNMGDRVAQIHQARNVTPRSMKCYATANRDTDGTMHYKHTDSVPVSANCAPPAFDVSPLVFTPIQSQHIPQYAQTWEEEVIEETIEETIEYYYDAELYPDGPPAYLVAEANKLSAQDGEVVREYYVDEYGREVEVCTSGYSAVVNNDLRYPQSPQGNGKERRAYAGARRESSGSTGVRHNKATASVSQAQSRGPSHAQLAALPPSRTPSNPSYHSDASSHSSSRAHASWFPSYHSIDAAYSSPTVLSPPSRRQ